MSWPLRATGVASTKSGGIFVTGTGCDGELRSFFWPAATRAPVRQGTMGVPGVVVVTGEGAVLVGCLTITHSSLPESLDQA